MALPHGYTIVDFGIGPSFRFVSGLAPSSTVTEVWISYWNEETNGFAPLVAVNLPSGCVCIQRVTYADEFLFLLSETGVLWSWRIFTYEDILPVNCLEPIFKVCREKVLTVTGNVYSIALDTGAATPLFKPPVFLTDIKKEVGRPYILTDRNRNFFTILHGYLQPLEVQASFHEPIVWLDWGTGSEEHALDEPVLSLLGTDFVWQWDLDAEKPLRKMELKLLTCLKIDQSKMEIIAGMFHCDSYVVYMASNGHLFYTPDSLNDLFLPDNIIRLYVDRQTRGSVFKIQVLDGQLQILTRTDRVYK
eukprot:Platyproteum_vivax@DN10153_c0_g1_i1.p1